MAEVQSKLRLFVRQLSPVPEKIEPFTKSQWSWCPSIALAVFYGVVTIYSLNAFTLWYKSAVLQYDVGVFLTTWSYCTVFLHFLLSTLIVCTHHVSVYCLQSRSAVRNRRSDEDSSNQDGQPDTNDIVNDDASNISENNTSNKWITCRDHFLKHVTIPASWILSNIVFVFAIVVTGVYYTVICPKDVTCGRFSNINVHALNTVFIVVDVIVNGRPVRMFHVVYPFIFGFIYVMFTVFFWAPDHSRVIYRIVLNWNKPGLTIGVLVGAIIGIALLHALHLGIYKLKLYLYNRKYQEPIRV
ncbi:uncharacterized protein LOC124254726 isoform X2 [Haliotis rubra]|uniref:uncharacterized protein LOC124254726 isoform X2 n=1 Tax=Haliotis rubra TaxID=36100 RepID=UPI001EE55B65|nr:uncharacterized protein LOC124254726 isoform X2 [Haliotis rubra]